MFTVEDELEVQKVYLTLTGTAIMWGTTINGCMESQRDTPLPVPISCPFVRAEDFKSITHPEDSEPSAWQVPVEVEYFVVKSFISLSLNETLQSKDPLTYSSMNLHHL